MRDKLVENLPKAGSVLETTVNEPIDVTTFTLSNGAKVSFKKTDFKDVRVTSLGNFFSIKPVFQYLLTHS